jgi:hypothetical protein
MNWHSYPFRSVGPLGHRVREIKAKTDEISERNLKLRDQQFKKSLGDESADAYR